MGSGFVHAGGRGFARPCFVLERGLPHEHRVAVDGAQVTGAGGAEEGRVAGRVDGVEDHRLGRGVLQRRGVEGRLVRRGACVHADRGAVDEGVRARGADLLHGRPDDARFDALCAQGGADLRRELVGP